jgi:hypothetical protein
MFSVLSCGPHSSWSGLSLHSAPSCFPAVPSNLPRGPHSRRSGLSPSAGPHSLWSGLSSGPHSLWSGLSFGPHSLWSGLSDPTQGNITGMTRAYTTSMLAGSSPASGKMGPPTAGRYKSGSGSGAARSANTLSTISPSVIRDPHRDRENTTVGFSHVWPSPGGSEQGGTHGRPYCPPARGLSDPERRRFDERCGLGASSSAAAASSASTASAQLWSRCSCSTSSTS